MNNIVQGGGRGENPKEKISRYPDPNSPNWLVFLKPENESLWIYPIY